MKENNEIGRELEELKATQLSSWRKRAARPSLSDDYWDSQLNQAIATAEKKVLEEPVSRRSLFYVASIAAGLLLILAGAWLYFQTPISTPSSIANEDLAAISDDEIVNYIQDNLDDFDLALLSTYVQNTDFELPAALDIDLDVLEEGLPEETEWLYSDEEGIELF